MVINIAGYQKLDTNYEYVIVETGYTSRITSRENLDQRKEFWSEIYDRYDGDSVDYKPDIELIFAYDTVWGNGLYREGKDADEVAKLIKITKKLKLYKCGIACFKCDKTAFADLARAIDSNTYCVTFDIDEMEFYKSDNPNEPTIMFVSWDSESG